MNRIGINEEAIVELGKKLLIDSVEVSRKYSENMITISVNAIPVYTGLIVFVKKEEDFFTCLPYEYKVLMVLPLLIYVSCLIVFIFSYRPKHDDLNLSNLTGLENTIKSILKKRRNLSNLGSILFFIATLLSIYNVFSILF